MDILDSIENAIGDFEGFGTPGNPATTNHNPGNLMYAPWEQTYGATKSSSGFAVFPDDQSGFDALDTRVQQLVGQGASISDLINTWSPANAPGNSATSTQNYINYVAGAAGIDSSTPISQAISTSGASNGASTNSSPSWWDSLNSTILGSAGSLTPGRIQSAIQSGTANSLQTLWSSIEQWFGSTFGASRVTTVLVGLLLLAGGIFLFKPVRDTANTVVETVKRGAAKGAEVAVA